MVLFPTKFKGGTAALPAAKVMVDNDPPLPVALNRLEPSQIAITVVPCATTTVTAPPTVVLTVRVYAPVVLFVMA